MRRREVTLVEGSNFPRVVPVLAFKWQNSKLVCLSKELYVSICMCLYVEGKVT